jgi:hypothetical protein
MITDLRLYTRKMTNAALWVFVSILFAASANAGGYGGYVGYVHSEGSVEFDLFASDIDIDHENDIFEFGFVLDTNLAQDRLFNYRLNVGVQNGEREYTERRGSLKEETAGVSINNVFGFGIVRTPSLRLWVGPAVRFSVDACTDCSGYDSTFIALGAGPEIGVNFNLGEHLTISPTLGYQYMYGTEFIEVGGEDEDFSGGQHHVSLLFSVMFRTGSDSFQ